MWSPTYDSYSSVWHEVRCYLIDRAYYRVTIDSDNGLSPIRLQITILTTALLLSIGFLGTNLGDILIKILFFDSRK